MELRDGDQIMFRRNDNHRGITNGDTAKIKIAEDGRIEAHTKTGEIVELKNNEVVDYSYARTIHSSQGATVDRAIVVGQAGRTATANAAYVACSREKHGLEIITDNREKLAKGWRKFAAKETAIMAAKRGNVLDRDDLRLRAVNQYELEQAKRRQLEIEEQRRRELQQQEELRRKRDEELEQQRRRQTPTPPPPPPRGRSGIGF
ncbi:MAG: hypothetical protein K0041_07575, partial [Acidithiobacillus sp.]|nr:hypothetical protein [Acidithiobacillus sp.]